MLKINVLHYFWLGIYYRSTTIGYTIGFSKCYDISYFICNACNVDDFANGDVIGYAIVSNISYAISSTIVIPLAVPLAMSFAYPKKIIQKTLSSIRRHNPYRANSVIYHMQAMNISY